jgi:hypothetical protein
MTKSRAKTETLDFRFRSWLVRRISGKHKTENLRDRYDKVVMHAIVETLHKDISKSISEMVTKSVANLPAGLLSEIISENKHLTDKQKAQIASIFDSPAVDNSRSYLQ